MCTLSWLPGPDGFTVLVNRDEQRSRARALPPAEHRWGGVRVVAPLDPVGGGTWIAANEHGVVLALLNCYDGHAVDPCRRRSRGLLMRDLASAASQAQVVRRAERAELDQYASFTLAVFEPGRAVCLLSWDGSTLATGAHRQAGLVRTSSSWDQTGAEQLRRELFARAAAGMRDERALAAAHGTHVAGAEGRSPCMHRAEAETVSFTRIAVGPALVTTGYQEGAPCRAGEQTQVALMRAAGLVRPRALVG